MKQQKNYSKLIKALKKNPPILQDKDQLAGEVMRKIRATRLKHSLWAQLESVLFDWVHSFSWRLAMAAVTFFFIGFFAHQQLILNQRIASLERQLAATANVTGYQDEEPGILQRALIKMAIKDKVNQDSMTLSTNEVEALLKAYMEATVENESLKHSTGAGSFFGKNPTVRDQEKGNVKDL